MAKSLKLSSDRKLAGVCGGVAEYLGIDSTVVRIIWLLMVLCYGVGALAYLVCWAIMPKA